MSKRPSEVLVVDSEKRFLEYTSPALARTYLKEGKARVFSRNPFTIQLRSAKDPSSIRRSQMSIRNFTDYFKAERDVFIQNISNAQLSLEFNMGEGRIEGFTVPATRDPINLTQHIPFNAIKNSMDFRKMLSRRPPVLHLLDEAEFTAYFAARAKSNNLVNEKGEPDVDAAMDMAEEKRRRVSDKSMRQSVTSETPKPIHTVTEKGTGPKGAKHFGERERVAPSDVIAEDEAINPRVLHLCNQVKQEVPEEERMSAAQLLEELQAIPQLSMDDLEHVRAHGFYKSVKKWAKQESSKLVEASEGTEDTEDAEGTQATAG